MSERRASKRIHRWAKAALALALPAALGPGRAWACAACYGASDSPMAEGMNWGILSLLGIIALVLVAIAGFFVFLARKSASISPTSAGGELAGSAQANPL